MFIRWFYISKKEKNKKKYFLNKFMVNDVRIKNVTQSKKKVFFKRQIVYHQNEHDNVLSTKINKENFIFFLAFHQNKFKKTKKFIEK